MSSSLDMSLDDLIKKNKQSNPRSTGGGPGPTRRFTNRSANRPTPYHFSAPKAPEDTWQHDMYSEQAQAQELAGGYRGGGGRPTAIETGTKILISNLDYGVSNEDIKELFSEVGDMKRCSIHYDRSGRSKGTAEVTFSRRQDAIAAVKRYNDVQLDGKPMKIELVRTNITTPPVAQVSNRSFGNSNGIPRSFPPRGGFNGSSRGGGGGGGGRGWGRGGRGRGRARADPVSSVDLDADLDKYHSEAMQTN